MQYFVSVEDTQESRWQVELLIESLRLLGVQDKLVVAACTKGTQPGKIRHHTVVRHENVGRKTGYLPLNKPFGLITAIKDRVLGQPFVVLEPDMFLLKTIPKYDARFVAQTGTPWEVASHFLNDKLSESDWVGVDSVYQFNDVPPRFFEYYAQYTFALYQQYGPHPDLHRMVTTFSLLRTDVPITLRDDLEMPLSNGAAHVVHYRHGCPPYFIKKSAWDSLDFAFGMPLPFKKILECPVQDHPAVSLLQTLVRSWMHTNQNRVVDLMF